MPRLLLLALALLLAAPAAAHARAGDVDRSFGSGGSVTFQSLGPDVFFTAVALQPDGKIVAAADRGNGLTVVRLTRSGALDRRFGTRGRVRIPIRGAGARDIALFRDGRILVAGIVAADTEPSHIVVARLLPSGDLDPNFGTDGVGVVGPPSSQLDSMALARDGEVVLGGSLARPDRPVALVLRLLTDGTPDPDFSGDGAVDTSAVGIAGRARDVVVLPDGSVGAAVSPELGRVDPGTFVAIRLTPAGAFDPAFGLDGVVDVLTTPLRLSEGGAAAIAAGPDGSLILAGTVRGERRRDDPLVLRLTAAGALDPGFGRNGGLRLIASSGRSVHINAMARAPGGRLVLGGYSEGNAAVLRLTAGGRRDTRFGRGGALFAALGRPPDGHRSDSLVVGLAVRSDGRIVTAGAVAGRRAFYPVVARLR
jgi:uncharacterized delta-60 repeat protein